MFTGTGVNEISTLIGAALALLAIRHARGPYSIWFAHLPGTLAHELAHYFLAVLFRSRPRPPSLRLRRSERGWVLGSVQFEPRALSAGAIALAPLILLPPLAVLIWLLSREGNALHALLSGYAAATVLYGAAPSATDWKVALRYPIGALVALSLVVLAVAAIFSGKG